MKTKYLLMLLVLLGVETALAGGVVHVPPPTGDDHAVLQAAINDNPGSTLKLKAGTYNIGDNMLVVPHGITIRGAGGRKGPLRTTVQGNLMVIYIYAVGPYAYDDIALRNLRVSTDLVADNYVGDYRAAINHQPGLDCCVPNQQGGGNLTIANVEVYAAGAIGIRARHTDGVDLRIVDSTIESGQWDAIVLSNSTNRTTVIRGNRLITPHDGIEIWHNGFWESWQDPAAMKPVWIIGNDIQAATRPFPWPVQMGLHLLPEAGTVYAINNSIHIPGSELEGHGSAGITWQPQRFAESARLEAWFNRITGGDGADGKARAAIQVFGSDSVWVQNSAHGSFGQGVISSVAPIGLKFYASNNRFYGTDFRNAELYTQTTFPFEMPPVHWWFDDTSSDNVVTDFSGVEQLVVDDGTNNQFRGGPFTDYQ